MSPATLTLASITLSAPLTDNAIATLIALRPDTEPFGEAVAHVAYWTLVEMQEAGASSPEMVATIRRFADWKAARSADSGGELTGD